MRVLFQGVCQIAMPKAPRHKLQQTPSGLLGHVAIIFNIRGKHHGWIWLLLL
jgi:hypothetical protein